MADSAVVHVIDDDESVRHALAFLLATSGLAVRVHERGSAFLESADGLQGGCILTDVRMPGIDGLALQLRLKERGVNLPVIIMTGHGDVALAVEAMKAGAVDFIEKPFNDAALLGAIGAALQPQSATAGDSQAKSEAEARLAELSPRERDVLRGLVAGK